MKKDKINYGISLFKIVAMLMVIGLHIHGQGGALSAATGFKFYVAWFLYIIFIGAVNCFALISGYLMYSHKISFKKNR